MRRRLIWILPLAVLFGLVVWRFVAKGQAEGALQQMGGARRGMSASAEVVPAAQRLIVSVLQTVGNVESPFRVEVSPKSSGRIEYLKVREGDPVQVGEILVKIDPSDLQGQVLQQQANVAEARSRLAQAEISQGSTNVGITSQIRQQRAGLTSAQADLLQVQRNFDAVGSSRVDLQACKLEYSIVSPK